MSGDTTDREQYESPSCSTKLIQVQDDNNTNGERNHYLVSSKQMIEINLCKNDQLNSVKWSHQPNEAEKAESQLIRTICPLSSHNNNRNNDTRCKILSQLNKAILLRSPAGLANNRSMHSESKTQSPRDSNSTNLSTKSTRPNGSNKIGSSTMRLIESPEASKSLRQIYLVGQLNHSASKGLLLILINVASLCLVSLFLQFHCQHVDAYVWPFSNATNYRGDFWHKYSGQPSTASNTKRQTRTTPTKTSSFGAEKSATRVQPLASQQFHYFWNHDQIEPKIISSEAEKILADAQRQTDDIALSSSLALDDNGNGKSVNPSANSRQDSEKTKTTGSNAESILKSQSSSDPLQTSGSQPFPISIPPAIDQQLTNMVLQMQRQQRMSMLMQPRFYPADQIRRQSSNPISIVNPHWVSGSSQHAVIAPPPLLHHNHQSLLSASEAMPSLASSPQQIINDVSLLSRASTAAFGNVPIHGPFMINPSPYVMQAAFQRQMLPPSMLNNQHSTNLKQANSQQPTGRFSSSFLGRRKSKPFFSFGSQGTNTHRGSGSPSVMLQSASQMLPTVALPPAPIATSSDSTAILDAASSHLITALANQVQQKLAEAIVQLAIQRDQQQAASRLQNTISQPLNDARASALITSSPSATPADVQIGQKPVNLQAPYQVITSGLLGSAQSALNQLISLSQQPAKIIPQVPMELVNLTSLPFGQRFKRRHLNTTTSPIIISTTKRPQIMINQKQRIKNYPVDGVFYTHLEVDETPLTFADPNKSDHNHQQMSVNHISTPRKKVINNIVSMQEFKTKDETFPSGDPSTREENEEQTQLRRLKRSVLVSITGNTLNKYGSNVASASWSPMPSTPTQSSSNSSKLIETRQTANQSPRIVAIDPIEDAIRSSSYESNRTSFREPKSLTSFIKLRKEKPSIWLASNPSSSLLRRQADLQIGNANQLLNSSNQDSKESETSSSNQDGTWAQNSPKDKTKSRRINTGVTAMHYAMLKGRTKDSIGNLKRGFVMVGTPGSLLSSPDDQATTKPRAQTEDKNSSAKNQDPMNSSLSESTRIANYFQNVENESKSASKSSSSNNEPTSSGSSQNQIQIQQQQQQLVATLSSPATHELSTSSQTAARTSSKQVDPDQVSVGFPSPNHITNSNKHDTDGLANMQSIFSPTGTQSQSFNHLGFTNSNLNPTLSSAQNRQQSGLSSSITSQLGAHSGDISSAATGAQGHLAQPNGLMVSGAASQRYRSLGPNSLISGNAARPRNLVGPGINQRSSAPSATVVAPVSFMSNGRMALGSKSTVNDDRSTSADQSNSYNEEMVPLPQTTNYANDPTNMSMKEMLSSSMGAANGNYDGTGSSGNAMGPGLNNAFGQDQQVNDQSNSITSQQSFGTNELTNQFIANSAYEPETNNSALLLGSAYPGQADSNSQSELNNGAGNVDIMKARYTLNGPNQQSPNSYTPNAILMSNNSAQPSLISEESPESVSSINAQDVQSNQQQAMGFPTMSNEVNSQQLLTNQPTMQPVMMSSHQAALAISAFNHQQQQQQLQDRINQQFQESLRQFNQANAISSLSQMPASSSQRAALMSLYQPNQQLIQSQLLGYVDEDAAARAEAAAGISSYPNDARLIAMHNQHDRVSELVNGALHMAGSEQREYSGDDNSNESKSKGNKSKKAKKQGKNGKPFQPVSHHYHFNSFSSPFEDPENQYAPLNPLDLATALAGKNQETPTKGHRVKGHNDAEQADDDKKQQEQAEEQKPKKKGFLRRLSFKNLFKRFRKDKKKEREPEQNTDDSSSSNDNGNGNDQKS